MIYDTAKELEKLGIDWTAGAQGLQMICKHHPGKCPFYVGRHKDDELAEWPSLEEMIAACRERNSGQKDTFRLFFNRGRWQAHMDSVFSKHDLLEGFIGVGETEREAVAKLLIQFK